MPDVYPYVQHIDEVWHAGDIGDDLFREKIPYNFTFRAVHGNIDNHLVRRTYPEILHFELEQARISMLHIGGYPGRLTALGKSAISEFDPHLFITGHSHILKISRHSESGMLHMNPGSCGNHGFHARRTAIRFQVESGKFKNVEVIDLGKRGRFKPSPKPV